MNAPKKKNGELTTAEHAPASGPLDSGEARAILIGGVVLAIFLYFIKLILLPFVLAAIVAYICTPVVDWAVKRTRWPRLLFAIALFVVLAGITAAILTISAGRLATEARATAADLQVTLENVIKRRSAISRSTSSARRWALMTSPSRQLSASATGSVSRIRSRCSPATALRA